MTPIERNNPRHSWSRLDGVDCLRGLAIFFVLMNHVNMRLRSAKVSYTHGWPDQLVSSLLWNGQYGVQIFFVVSGFLITSTALRRWGSPSRVNVRDFYLLRFARIAPLLLAVLGLLSILALAEVKYFIVPANTGGLGRALVAVLTFHVNVLEARRGYLPANWDILWSLSVEEVFYLFFPLFCRLLGRGRLLVLVLLGFVALGPFSRTVLTHGNEVWQEYSYLGGMDAIALGCLTALLVSRRTASAAAPRILAIIGAALIVFILAFSLQARALSLSRTGLDMTVIAIGTCLVITAAFQTQWRSPAWLNPLLVLGRRSYEIYLTHMFLVLALFQVFLDAGKPMTMVPLFFISAIVLAGLTGDGIARFYSEPMNRLMRKRFGDGPKRLGSVVEGSR